MKNKLYLFLILFTQRAFAKSNDLGFSAEDIVNAHDIRDIKDPLLLSSNSNFLFMVIGVIFFLFIFKLIISYIFKKRREMLLKQQDPFQIWFSKLQELHDNKLLDKGHVHEFYVQMSDIVRHYLEDRFYLRAPEMTTEEFLHMIQDSGKIEQEHKHLLKDFLTDCDLVKFAKYGPDKKETENTYLSAVGLFEQTKPVEEKDEESLSEKGGEQ
jgi:hypothetical protein